MKTLYDAAKSFGDDVMADENIELVEIAIFKRNDRGMMERETHVLRTNARNFRQRPFHHTFSNQPFSLVSEHPIEYSKVELKADNGYLSEEGADGT